MLLAASLLALSTAAGAARADEPDGERPLVVRLHSLTGLVEFLGTHDGALSLLPYKSCAPETPPDVNREPGPCILHSEDLCALVREQIEPSFWDETPGTRVDLRGPDRMLVVAPQEIQEKVAELLGRLSAALTPTELLEVRLFESNAADADRNELAIDAAEADRRIAERGLLRHASVALRDRAVVEGGAVERATIVYDWEVEIAQGATIADPTIALVETGLRIAARSTRVEGGLLVNLIACASDQPAPTRPRQLPAKALVNAKPVMSDRVACGLFEHPQLRFASFAGTVFLPEGKAVWVPVEVATAIGPVRFCLDLRVAGRVGPVRATLETAGESDGAEMRFDLMSRGAADFGEVVVDRVGSSLFAEHWTQDGTGAIWARLLQSEGDEWLADLVNAVAEEPLSNGQGSVASSSGALRIFLPKGYADRVSAALAPLQRFDAGVLLRGRVLQDGKERASFRVPVVVDRPLALWSGAQGTRIADWDVEVANEAQACNPQPEAWVDGFALRVVVHRNARGEFVLDTNAKLSLLEGLPEAVDLQDDSHMTIDRVRARTLFVDELRTLSAQGGTATYSGEVTLELEVSAGR